MHYKMLYIGGLSALFVAFDHISVPATFYFHELTFCRSQCMTSGVSRVHIVKANQIRKFIHNNTYTININITILLHHTACYENNDYSWNMISNQHLQQVDHVACNMFHCVVT